MIKEIRKIKLGKQSDYIVLPGGPVRIPFETLFPDLLYGPVRSQTYYKLMRIRTKTKKTIVKGIVKNVPFFTPEELLPNIYCGTKADPLICDAVQP